MELATGRISLPLPSTNLFEHHREIHNHDLGHHDNRQAGDERKRRRQFLFDVYLCS